MTTVAAIPGLTVDADGLARLRRALLAMVAGALPAPAGGTTDATVDATVATPVQRPMPGQAATEPHAAPPGIPSPARPPEPTDAQSEVMAIISRAQAGESEAFGELYDRYSQTVYRYIAYRCGNVTLAEDLTSETFLRALRRISSYTWQGRDFGAWLVTIARNLLADHYKSGRYRLEVATSDLVAAGADGREDGPEDTVLASLTNERLVEAIRQLGGEQQECIVLRFLQGMSLAETAAILGKNEGAIKALQYRAVKALGRLLPPETLA
jgi:RNA polymerase sigma-70 factor (ECF subfamily)